MAYLLALYGVLRCARHRFLAPVAAEGAECERYVTRAACPRHAQKNVVVRSKPQLRIDPSDAHIDVARPEAGILQRRPPTMQHGGGQIIDETTAVADHVALLVDVEVVAEDHVGIACGEDLAHFRKRPVKQKIAGIDPAEHVAGRAPEALGKRVRIALVRLADPLRDRCLVLADDIDAAVGRSTIDHDILVAGGEVVAHGRDGLAEITRHVEIDGDNRDSQLGRGHTAPTRFSAIF